MTLSLIFGQVYSYKDDVNKMKYRFVNIFLFNLLFKIKKNYENVFIDFNFMI
jgi:hypothetical protein